jgi:hypothetical protein
MSLFAELFVGVGRAELGTLAQIGLVEFNDPQFHAQTETV